MLKDLFEDVIESLMQQPWYLNIGFIAGFLFTLLTVLVILILMVEITKALFAGDIIGIGITIYIAISSHAFSSDIMISIVLLCVAFLILLFLLYCNEDYNGESIGGVILDAFFGGVWNLCILSSCFLIFTLPFALKSLGKSDRYH